MTPALERMIKGRVGLLAREPFFATLAMTKLELVEDAKCKTTWCDGRRLGFNPEHVLALDSIDVIESIWAHHVATCALGHPFRRGARREDLWNDASDHCVNGYITKAGFKLPEGSLYDPQYDGMYAEQIYSKLLQQEQPGDDDDSQQGTDPDSDAGQSASGGEGDDAGGGDSSDGSAAADGQGTDATGELRDATSEEGAGEDQSASASEKADQEADWKTAVAQAEQASKAAGHLPGSVERLAQASLESLVDWREALQRLLKAKAKTDFTMRRPNRRFIPLGVYAPSMYSDACGPLAFAIDASGSITQHDINQFVSEIEEARQTMRPSKIIAYVFDDGVRTTSEFGPDEPIELPAFRAGGGTSFIHPVLKANELEEVPEALIFLTDLASSQFADEPMYPVVWVTTSLTVAPYGDVIKMIR